MLSEWSQDSQGGSTQGTENIQNQLVKGCFCFSDILSLPQTLLVKVCGVICSVVGGLAVGKVDINTPFTKSIH